MSASGNERRPPEGGPRGGVDGDRAERPTINNPNRRHRVVMRVPAPPIVEDEEGTA